MGHRAVSVHILKMAVGIDSVDHLIERQKQRLDQARNDGGTGDLRHVTRNMPRRAGEITQDGSIYWIIKGFIRVRQRILGFEWVAGREGRRRCAVILDPELVQTVLQPRKPIQGWRYLDPAAAPDDLDAVAPEATGLPAPLAAELRALGLI
jgi:hypothetical protein